MRPPIKMKAALISRFKILSDLNIAERRLPQDGRIKLRIGKRVIDFRVSTLPTLFGEKIVLRILDKGNLTLDLEKFGMEPKAEKNFMHAIMNPYGMVLVTGPTGSGKTTTLYSALSKINTPEVNIMTAEDPVEYNLHGINQVQVRTEIGMTFAAALKAFLRQDPNIIMVGEIRDIETGGIAIKAALTGHLVLSTLHTNDAPSTITRMIDMGIEPFNVASAVNLITAQRLVRRICSGCKEPVTYSDEYLLAAGITPRRRRTHLLPRRRLRRVRRERLPRRQGLYEVMAMSPTLRRMILQGASTAELQRAGDLRGDAHAAHGRDGEDQAGDHAGRRGGRIGGRHSGEGEPRRETPAGSDLGLHQGTGPAQEEPSSVRVAGGGSPVVSIWGLHSPPPGPRMPIPAIPDPRIRARNLVLPTPNPLFAWFRARAGPIGAVQIATCCAECGGWCRRMHVDRIRTTRGTQWTQRVPWSRPERTRRPQPLNLRALLDEMIRRNASDLHVTAGERPKLRVDGAIVNSQVEDVLTAKDTLALTYSILTESQKKRFENEDELDFSFGIQNMSRFRANAYKQRGCVALAIRQVPFQIKSLEQLQVPPVLGKLAERPRGLVLVTGPTGSGKSTTLAAMLDKINRSAAATSSPSRTRSSSCTATRGAW
jgi:type II secretory ATPase GspE/PulE/Tfp pilus assembly ATPase PilB-like protein